METWRVSVGRGFAFGIALMAAIALVNAALIGMTASQPISLGTFIAGVAVLSGFLVVGLIAYWVYGLAGASYLLDRNQLVIRWGPSRQVIPMSEIEGLLTGDQVDGSVRFYGGRWPGHFVGFGELQDLGQALFYATVPPQAQILIATPGLIYGISPSDPGEFLRSFSKRLQMGPTQRVEQSSQRLSVLDWPIWKDSLGLTLLGAATLALASLLATVCFRFPALPPLVPLHFGPTGSPDRLGPRGDIFLLPLVGLSTLVLNGALGSLLYGRDRVASYLLWGGAILVQLLVWTAMLGVLTRL